MKIPLEVSDEVEMEIRMLMWENGYDTFGQFFSKCIALQKFITKKRNEGYELQIAKDGKTWKVEINEDEETK